MRVGAIDDTVIVITRAIGDLRDHEVTLLAEAQLLRQPEQQRDPELSR